MVVLIISSFFIPQNMGSLAFDLNMAYREALNFDKTIVSLSKSNSNCSIGHVGKNYSSIIC
jgi:hypothetical protein